ncbi:MULTISPECIES: hypothetical protein [Pseudomonas]|jgi:hypothetical protein|uniref:hypothetical protein n=1 Tax=Pseudomonas TaxID=286 RepID=UPI00235FD02D|nr:hypothetical protein [Pseudomonas sp. TNT2022 ID642]MDD1003603.1 hypothetical protein [Pseudomonas sp. TNT2022 ID642]
MQFNGIEYFSYPELPDRVMFSCTRRQASLQVETCSGMWQEANGKNPPDRLAQCKSCPVGATHADEVAFDVSSLWGSGLCARCHRGGFRLVAGDLCVSCWNRAREVLKGCNRRGKAPKNHPSLAPRTIRILVNGAPVLITREHSVRTEELIIAALRDSARQPLFGLYVAHEKLADPAQEEWL